MKFVNTVIFLLFLTSQVSAKNLCPQAFNDLDDDSADIYQFSKPNLSVGNKNAPPHWKYIYEEVAKPTLEVTKKAKGFQVGRQTLETHVEKTDRWDIELLMKDYKLTRLQAVEVQAQYRRQFGLTHKESDFENIIKRVRENKFMSRANVQKLKEARFIVLLDVDGTILDQDAPAWIKGYHDFQVLREGDKEVNVSLSPGYDAFIKDVHAKNGAVVLYSRNSDFLIQGLSQLILVNGKPLLSIVDGIFSSSHMVAGRSFKRARGVQRLKDAGKLVRKDLRIFNELSGENKTIIVDDDPDFIEQSQAIRVVTAYKTHVHGFDKYIDKHDERDAINLKKSKRNEWLTISSEIEETLNYMENHDTDFEIAYFPYTYRGVEIRDYLAEQNSVKLNEKTYSLKDDRQIVDFLRENHNLISELSKTIEKIKEQKRKEEALLEEKKWRERMKKRQDEYGFEDEAYIPKSDWTILSPPENIWSYRDEKGQIIPPPKSHGKTRGLPKDIDEDWDQ